MLLYWATAEKDIAHWQQTNSGSDIGKYQVTLYRSYTEATRAFLADKEPSSLPIIAVNHLNSRLNSSSTKVTVPAWELEYAKGALETQQRSIIVTALNEAKAAKVEYDKNVLREQLAALKNSLSEANRELRDLNLALTEAQQQSEMISQDNAKLVNAIQKTRRDKEFALEAAEKKLKDGLMVKDHEIQEAKKSAEQYVAIKDREMELIGQKIESWLQLKEELQQKIGSLEHKLFDSHLNLSKEQDARRVDHENMNLEKEALTKQIMKRVDLFKEDLNLTLKQSFEVVPPKETQSNSLLQAEATQKAPHNTWPVTGTEACLSLVAAGVFWYLDGAGIASQMLSQYLTLPTTQMISEIGISAIFSGLFFSSTKAVESAGTHLIKMKEKKSVQAAQTSKPIGSTFRDQMPTLELEHSSKSDVPFTVNQEQISNSLLEATNGRGIIATQYQLHCQQQPALSSANCDTAQSPEVVETMQSKTVTLTRH